MLVQKETKDKAYIGALKLTTGEEIIALIKGEENGFLVSNPLAMVMAENPDNPQQTRVMFTPWMVAGSGEDITIQHNHVVAKSVARKDAADQYEAATK